MKMKNVLVPAITILVVAAILLGVGYGTAGLRAANIQKEHIYMMQTLLPGSADFVIEPYTAEDESIRSVHKAENGFVVEVETRGYADTITMLVGVNNAGKVTGVVVRDMAETFGLGMNALTDHVFLSQFLNTSGNVEIAVSADAASFATGEADSADTAAESVTVDGITGATVTSKAIARCINSAVAVVTGADAASAATSWGG